MNKLISTFFLTAVYSLSFGTVDTTGLIGYWPFDGDAKDQTANGNDGTVTSAVLTADRHGNANKAYYFDGTGDYINLGRDASIQPTTMTVSAWFRLDDTTEHHAIISCRNANDGEWGMDMYHHKDFGIITSLGAGSSNRAIGHHTLTNLTDDDWHMVTFVYDGANNPTRYATYLDCEFLGYENRTGSSGGLQSSDLIAYTNKNDWIIGAHSQYFSDAVNQGHYFFKGAIDDVVIYNRALSESEIKVLGGKTSTLEERAAATLKVYPNPTFGQITVQSNGFDMVHNGVVTVQNSLGQQLLSTPITSEFMKIQMDAFASGIYVISIVTSDGVAVLREKVMLD